MKISIITLFPELFSAFLKTSIIGKAHRQRKLRVEIINLRQFGLGKHQTVDDRPYGGGVGMIFKANVLTQAWKKTQEGPGLDRGISKLTVLMSASGKPFNQQKAKDLSRIDHLIIICGRYEGVDQRFIDKYVDGEISIGDYVLMGGEIPAMVVVEAITRLIPGVLKKEESLKEESFSDFRLPSTVYRLLEYPHYTRPQILAGRRVPRVLLSGDHQKITEWRRKKALEKTKKVRPDLLK